MQKTSKIIIISMLVQTILLVFLNLYTYASNSIGELKSLLPFLNLFNIVISGIVIFSIRRLESLAKKEAEMMTMKENLSQIESLLRTLHTQRHEYNRHLQTLQAMIHLGAIEEAIHYMDGITLENLSSDDIIYVGNPILTALLNSKGRVAESKNIKFDFAIKCDLSGISIPNWELSSILGNLLDNAFEAVLLRNKKHRNVGLEIKQEQGEYVIYVFNNGPTIHPKDIDRIFQAGYTTKGSQGRGYGLFLVKNIMEEYGGRMEVISNKRTLFKCYLPGKEEPYGESAF